MKCDLCRRSLSHEEYAADPQLCSDCLKRVTNFNTLDKEAVRAPNSNRLFKICWFLVCAVLTAVGSYNLSSPIFWILDYIFGRSGGGFIGNSVLCLAATIPGLLGFFIAFAFYGTKQDSYSRSAQSAAIGIAVACISSTLLGIWG